MRIKKCWKRVDLSYLWVYMINGGVLGGEPGCREVLRFQKEEDCAEKVRADGYWLQKKGK